MRTKEEIENMRDRVCYEEKQRLNKELSGMSYAEGIEAALEWALGKQCDDELLNTQ